MASHYFALELGADADEVATGSSTQSKTVEVAVDLADGATREQVLALLEFIEDAISTSDWPPA